MISRSSYPPVLMFILVRLLLFHAHIARLRASIAPILGEKSKHCVFISEFRSFDQFCGTLIGRLLDTFGTSSRIFGHCRTFHEDRKSKDSI